MITFSISILFLSYLLSNSLPKKLFLSTPTNGGGRIFFGKHFAMLTAIVADTILNLSIVKISTTTV